MTDFETIANLLPDNPSGSPRPVGGGCIHESWVWGPYFIKTNGPSHDDGFRAEAAGLRALAAADAIRVPEVILQGTTDERAYLVLEKLDLAGAGDDTLLGEQLAALHGHTADRYGFPEPNYIGATPQPNEWLDDWPAFFRDRRLGHMVRLLEAKGVTFPEAERFLERLPELLPPDNPPASLLHGDLWAGNKAFLADGTPVLFDPACYHGHAACDLAMTELFGGFGRRFREAYAANAPDGFLAEELHDLYNLYHLLNHALLFGGGYASQARSIMKRHL